MNEQLQEIINKIQDKINELFENNNNEINSNEFCIGYNNALYELEKALNKIWSEIKH